MSTKKYTNLFINQCVHAMFTSRLDESSVYCFQIILDFVVLETDELNGIVKEMYHVREHYNYSYQKKKKKILILCLWNY